MAEILHKFVVDYDGGSSISIEHKPNINHNQQTLIISIDQEFNGVVSFELDAPDVKELVKFLQREVQYGKD